MDDLTVIGNLAEAVLWMAFAAIFAALAYRASERKRRLWLILTVSFLAFSASDVIESQTGAWWRPLWLLVLKTSCIGVFLYGAWEYRRIRLNERTQQVGPANGIQPIRSETNGTSSAAGSRR